MQALDNLIEKQLGLIAWFGHLASNGENLKRSAANSNLFEHEESAVVFDSLAEFTARIDNSQS